MSPRRTSYTFPPQAVAQLEAIRLRTRLLDNSEVIRTAICAYDDLVTRADEGKQMFIQDVNGDRWPFSPYVKLEYPGLKRAEMNAEAAAAAPKYKAATYFFSGDIIRKIESLKKASHLSSNVETIRVALSALKEVVLVLKAGDNFFIRDIDGKTSPYNAFKPFGANAYGDTASEAAPKRDLQDAQ